MFPDPEADWEGIPAADWDGIPGGGATPPNVKGSDGPAVAAVGAAAAAAGAAAAAATALNSLSGACLFPESTSRKGSLVNLVVCQCPSPRCGADVARSPLPRACGGPDGTGMLLGSTVPSFAIIQIQVASSHGGIHPCSATMFVQYRFSR